MPLFISPNTDHVWGNYSTNYQNETKYLFKGLSSANYYALHWFLKDLLWVPTRVGRFWDIGSRKA